MLSKNKLFLQIFIYSIEIYRRQFFFANLRLDHIIHDLSLRKITKNFKKERDIYTQ